MSHHRRSPFPVMFRQWPRRFCVTDSDECPPLEPWCLPRQMSSFPQAHPSHWWNLLAPRHPSPTSLASQHAFSTTNSPQVPLQSRRRVTPTSAISPGAVHVGPPFLPFLSRLPPQAKCRQSRMATLVACPRQHSRSPVVGQTGANGPSFNEKTPSAKKIEQKNRLK